METGSAIFVFWIIIIMISINRLNVLRGFGVIKFVISSTTRALQEIDQFTNENRDWIFGHLSYDLKNEIEELSSENKDQIGFEDFYFFVPEIVFIISKDSVNIGADETVDTKTIFEEIISKIPEEKHVPKPELKSKFSKEEYLETVKKLQRAYFARRLLRNMFLPGIFCRKY